VSRASCRRQSERLGGQPKGLIEIEGRRIVDRQLEALRAVFDRVFMVANDPRPWADLGIAIVPTVSRRRPAGGHRRRAGGARAARGGVVCVAGDMPFLDPGALALLRDHPPAQAVVPRWAATRAALGPLRPQLRAASQRASPRAAEDAGASRRARRRLPRGGRASRRSIPRCGSSPT
jgi:molybdopterin-guanine dinucleotide biosynthesis protein A